MGARRRGHRHCRRYPGAPLARIGDGLRARRRPRQPAARADRLARQARGLFRRQVAHHRLRPVERAQLRHPPHRRRHPVQGAQPDPPPAARLELLPARAQRELRHPAGEPARLGRTHWYAGTADAVYQNIDIIESYGPKYIVILAGDHIYKMDYEKMLAAACRAGRRRDRRLPRGAAHGGDRLRRHACRRRRPHHRVRRKAEGSAAACPDSPTWRSPSMGIYVFETALPDRPAPPRRRRSAFAATTSARTSSPTSSSTARRSRIASPAPACAPAGEAVVLLARRRHRRRLLGGQHRPHRHRARSSTSTTATGRSGPMREITPPAKFVHDQEAGAAGGLLAGVRRLHRLGRDGAAVAAVHRRPHAFLFARCENAVMLP